MKLLKLPSNTLAQVNGKNYYLSNNDARITMIEGKTNDDEIERILSFKFLEDIDSNFEAKKNEIYFCGGKFPSTIIAKYLKKEIKEKTFTALVNGWRNGSRGIQNLEQLDVLQSFLDNNAPVVENGLIYMSANKDLPDFGEIPITISWGDPSIFEGKTFADYAIKFYPTATKKFMNKLTKKVFTNRLQVQLSYLYFSAFEPIFGWDKVVYLVNECTVQEDWCETRYKNVVKFVKEIEYKKNAMSFFNFFKKSKTVTLSFVDDEELLKYWSDIDFDKIKSTKDLEYIVKYIKELAKPNHPTRYNQDYEVLKKPFIDNFMLCLPKDTHQLATWAFELRNCMAGKSTTDTIIGVLKDGKKIYAGLQFHKSPDEYYCQFLLAHNKDAPEELTARVTELVKTHKVQDFYIKRGNDEPRNNASDT